MSREIAAQAIIAAQAPLAVQATLANARVSAEQGPAAAAAQFDDIQKRLMKTDDVSEGLKAFQERRPGRFTGQ